MQFTHTSGAVRSAHPGVINQNINLESNSKSSVTYLSPCAPDGRLSKGHRSRHRPGGRAMCERVKPRAVSAHVFSAAPCPPPAAVPRDPGSTPVDPPQGVRRASGPEKTGRRREWICGCRSDVVQFNDYARHLKSNSAVGSQPLKSSSSCSRSASMPGRVNSASMPSSASLHLSRSHHALASTFIAVSSSAPDSQHSLSFIQKTYSLMAYVSANSVSKRSGSVLSLSAFLTSRGSPMQI